MTMSLSTRLVGPYTFPYFVTEEQKVEFVDGKHVLVGIPIFRVWCGSYLMAEFATQEQAVRQAEIFNEAYHAVDQLPRHPKSFRAKFEWAQLEGKGLIVRIFNVSHDADGPVTTVEFGIWNGNVYSTAASEAAAKEMLNPRRRRLTP